MHVVHKRGTSTTVHMWMSETILWNGFCPSTVIWVLGIKAKSPSLLVNTLSTKHLAGSERMFLSIGAKRLR